MNRFCIRAAERRIGISHRFDLVRAQCRGYIVPDGDNDLEVLPDLEYERKVSPGFAEDHIESLAVLRAIAEHMPDDDTILMHAVALAANDSAVLFTAPSGTGKTTHAMRWLEALPGSYVINGDKPFVRLAGNGVWVYGTPWCGKERLNRNCAMPVRAICLLERSEVNSAEELAPENAFGFLYRQIYHPADDRRLKRSLELLSGIMDSVKLLRIGMNNFAADVFESAFQAVYGA